MKKKKQEIRIHLDMSLQQAQIISEAVEEYMRLRMYQFSDLADVLARRNFQYDQSDPQCGEKFKAYMQRRDEITELFEQIRRVALDGAECADRGEDADIAGDLWSVLRHEIYKAKGGDPATGAYDSYPAIQLAREPLARCWFTAGDLHAESRYRVLEYCRRCTENGRCKARCLQEYRKLEGGKPK